MKQPKRFGTFVQTQTGRCSDARAACGVQRPGEGHIRNYRHALVAVAALVALGACASATRQRRPGPIEPDPPAHTASATANDWRGAMEAARKLGDYDDAVH